MNRHRVLLFARYAELLGAEEVAVDLPDRPTIATLLDALRALPGGALLPPRPVVARNLGVARLDDVIDPADELALLPPLAGG